jgi:hypothetical protein
VTSAEVSAVLADRGVLLREVPYPAQAGELRAYRQPDANIVISVVEGSYCDLYRVASSRTGIP